MACNSLYLPALSEISRHASGHQTNSLRKDFNFCPIRARKGSVIFSDHKKLRAHFQNFQFIPAKYGVKFDVRKTI